MQLIKEDKTMITVQRKQVNKVKQIPTQYNYNVKLNKKYTKQITVFLTCHQQRI